MSAHLSAQGRDMTWVPRSLRLLFKRTKGLEALHERRMREVICRVPGVRVVVAKVFFRDGDQARPEKAGHGESKEVSLCVKGNVTQGVKRRWLTYKVKRVLKFFGLPELCAERVGLKLIVATQHIHQKAYKK